MLHAMALRAPPLPSPKLSKGKPGSCRWMLLRVVLPRQERMSMPFRIVRLGWPPAPPDSQVAVRDDANPARRKRDQTFMSHDLSRLAPTGEKRSLLSRILWQTKFHDLSVMGIPQSVAPDILGYAFMPAAGASGNGVSHASRRNSCFSSLSPCGQGGHTTILASRYGAPLIRPSGTSPHLVA